MVKSLEGDDEQSTCLKSLFFSLDYHKLLPLAIEMFKKYREVCPDRIELRTMAAACKGFKKVYYAHVLLQHIYSNGYAYIRSLNACHYKILLSLNITPLFNNLF